MVTHLYRQNSSQYILNWNALPVILSSYIYKNTKYDEIFHLIMCPICIIRVKHFSSFYSVNFPVVCSVQRFLSHPPINPVTLTQQSNTVCIRACACRGRVDHWSVLHMFPTHTSAVVHSMFCYTSVFFYPYDMKHVFLFEVATKKVKGRETEGRREERGKESELLCVSDQMTLMPLDCRAMWVGVGRCGGKWQ